MNSLHFQNIAHFYKKTAILQDISFTTASSAITCLLGTSGSGKTTLLKLAAGLEIPHSGSIHLGETPITALAPEQRRIGLMFQEYALFPHLKIWENIAFGLPKKQKQQAYDWMDRLHIRYLADKYPHLLSGGEQQRVALARALAAQPQALLLDEPFGSLDAHTRHYIREETRLHLAKTGLASILVTHDAEEAMLLADKIILLHQGKIVQQGSPSDLYFKPASPFVVTFFSYANEVRAQVQDKLANTPFGMIPIQALTEQEHHSCATARVFIRPEAFRLETEAANAHSGIIRDYRFMGNRTVINLEINGGLLFQAAAPLGYMPVKDSTVHFSLDSRQIFVFPAA